MLDRGAPEDPVEIEERQWAGATGEVAWDVGSNMGQSVGRMLDRGFSMILAFEPAQESYERLVQDYGHHTEVRTFCMAIGDEAGDLTLAVRSAPILTGQLTAMNMPYRGEGQGQPGMANWGPDVGQRVVPCETLDSILAQYGPPDFVKVDVEGSEGRVLDGAATVLELGPRWLIEFHTGPLHDHCVSVLEDAGYTVETLRHPHYPEGTHMWTEHGWLRASMPE